MSTRTQRTPPATTQSDSIKRNLDQISPETPISKRMSTNDNMKSLKVSDMTVEQLLSVLATKEDFHEMKKEIQGLKDENKMLVDKVKVLSEKCEKLEADVNAVYIWKNSSNLIVKINRVGVDTEGAKTRVSDICSELSSMSGIVDSSAIRELNNNNRKKYTFKVFFKQTADAAAVLRNSNKLRGTDVSIAKDLPLVARQQKAKLLLIRRFLMIRGSCKPKLQGQFLTIGAVKLSWNISENKVMVSTGESFESFLGKYHLQVCDMEEFLNQQNQNNNARINQGSGSRTD